MKQSLTHAGVSAAIALSILAACVPAARPASIETTPTSVSAAPTHAAPAPLVCSTDYTRHEMPNPHPQDPSNPQPVFTLSPEEFSAAMGMLRISAVCVPEAAGAPYVAFDSRTFPAAAVTGRMITYSFEGWRAGQIVYSTYGVMIPTEYDTFATAADYESMQNASAPGFERIKVGLCYGRCTVYKTFVYPFADHYVALTLDLGAYEYGTAVDEQVAKFTAGEYPAELTDDLQRFDTLVRGIEFRE